MSVDGQGTKCRKNIVENFNRLSRVQCTSVTDRQQTDGWTSDSIQRRSRSLSKIKRVFPELSSQMDGHVFYESQRIRLVVTSLRIFCRVLREAHRVAHRVWLLQL